MTKPSESRYKQTDNGSKTAVNRSTVTGFSRNTLNKSLTSELPKVTTEFNHCGLGYSYSRQGMLVVTNNAVNQSSIKVDHSLTRSSEVLDKQQVI